MRVLVACEFSGAVRDAFIAEGHEATSCDLLPTEAPGPHYAGNVMDVLGDGWDLMVAHPPCTFLTLAGVRWLYGGKGAVRDPKRWAQMVEGAEFFRLLLEAPIELIAVENPIMHGYARDIVGQPFEPQPGCLRLAVAELPPPLQPTEIVAGREQRVWKLPPSPDRWKERSKTFAGIARAMAQQWGQPVAVQAGLW